MRLASRRSSSFSGSSNGNARKVNRVGELDKVVKLTLGAAIGAGFLVLIAKNGQQLGQFMSGTAETIVSFGKGIGSIS